MPKDIEDFWRGALLVPVLLAWAAVVGAGKPPAPGALILEGARREVEKGTPYVMNYEVIGYPGGDVTPGTGVCTDLVIRALRNAGIDVQKELHEDRSKHPEAYPVNLWDHKKPDRNIDHRRCPNLAVWLRRRHESITTSLERKDLAQWRAGDIVFYSRKGEKHPWHTAIISDRRATDGMPMIIDAFPPRTSETHRLDDFAPIHSHFRVTSEASLSPRP